MRAGVWGECMWSGRVQDCSSLAPDRGWVGFSGLLVRQGSSEGSLVQWPKVTPLAVWYLGYE